MMIHFEIRVESFNELQNCETVNDGGRKVGNKLRN